jgi:hypothetical protein
MLWRAGDIPVLVRGGFFLFLKDRQVRENLHRHETDVENRVMVID